MTVDEQQLRATEQRVVDAMHAADREGREPVELWARVERRLDRAAARRRWFPVTLAAGVAVTIIIAVVVTGGCVVVVTTAIGADVVSGAAGRARSLPAQAANRTHDRAVTSGRRISKDGIGTSLARLFMLACP